MSAPVKYFVGGELEAFIAGSHASTGWSTGGGTYDSDFARGSVALSRPDNAAYIRIPLTSAQATSYASLQLYRATNISGASPNPAAGVWLDALNASGVTLYRLQGVGGTQAQPLLQLYYWNGSSFVAIGNPMVVPTNTRHKFDFTFVQDGAIGVTRCYVDGVLMAERLGNTTPVSPSAVAELRVYTTGSFSSGNDFGAVYISEVQILDTSTLGRRLATLSLTGTGTTDGWTPSTGATSVATIDESGAYDDSDYTSSASANAIYTGVTSDLSLAAQQYAIDAVVIAYRALRGAVGPQNLKGVTRVGGTNYPSTNNVANLPAGAMGYTWAEFDLNPATAAAWTPTVINTAGFETGAKSIT